MSTASRSNATTRNSSVIFFLPSGEGPHPGLVLLGGSGGGIPNGVQAKLLASHGYAVLALAYFQPSELGADTDTADRPLDRVPETLHRVPLSYFDRAVSWLVDHEQVGAIGIHGGSRGSEPAVLTASRNEAVSSVVVSAPLAYAFCTFESDAFGEPASVDHIGLEEASAWSGSATNPSRQRDRERAPA
jgi:dienelactone hydrolase